ncbi:MAG: virulence protein RhuM/Fic/DOC family protein [Acidobacteria bacterium]|nr:virulence protein RhuM/Fic/DOC family protein [Acidobacteriota bacterium]
MSRAAEGASGEVVLYEAPDGQVRVDVRLERETVWLSLNQMAELFRRDKSVISRHLRNVFTSRELERKSVVAKSATTASDGKTYQVEYFNLDAILSVGYRVNSKRGTQFRIWATRTLHDHLLRGYTLNERRLREKGLGEMEQAVGLLARTLKQHALVTDEGRAVLDVVQQYTRAWRLLLEYDEDRLAGVPARPQKPAAELTLETVRLAIGGLRAALVDRGQASGLFGQERGDQLGAILGNIEQTFGGKPLYPSAQARAAHPLYFLIKDHPFSDGNKRIGALLFLEYLRRNGLLMREDGSPRLADGTMVALTLLVAESEAAQKDLMIRLILNLLDDGGA